MNLVSPIDVDCQKPAAKTSNGDQMTLGCCNLSQMYTGGQVPEF